MRREEAKEEIKRTVPCSRYMKKSKSGLYCCPACGSGTGNHATGAVKIYPDTNTWTCHACKTSGDVIDLYMISKGVDFNTAFNALAEDAGITIDAYSRPKEPKAEPIQTGTKAEAEKKDYTDYYRKCQTELKNNPAAIEYLNSRGIRLETALSCGIGFDAKADPAAAGHPTPRIIIPTSKSHYVGRRIDGVKDYAKINNKGGSPFIFNSNAIKEDAGMVFITEGAFDALSIIEAGGKAIALNSTSNTDLIINLLKVRKLQPKDISFVVCFDVDPEPATQERTTAAAEKLKADLLLMGYDTISFDIGPFLSVTENGKDLNDLLRREKDIVKKIITAAGYDLQKDELTDFFNKVQTTAYKPYKTGLKFFDDLLGGGILQQSLLLLLAPPGTGKTTLCMQIAEELAARKKPVIYINLEMSKEQMLAKALSYKLAQSGNPKTAKEVLQGYKWTDADRQQIAEAIDQYRISSAKYIKYNTTKSLLLADILDELEKQGKAAQERGTEAPAVILDYLHLVAADGMDEQEKIKQTVKGLKDYAIRYNTFCIAIAAIGRNSNNKIALSSGRDSSNLEYSADYQLSLNYYEVDQGNVSLNDPDAIQQEQGQKYRHMILRLLKGRLDNPAAVQKLYYNAAHNIFYGEGDWMPADPERVPFNAEPPKGYKKIV